MINHILNCQHVVMKCEHWICSRLGEGNATAINRKEAISTIQSHWRHRATSYKVSRLPAFVPKRLNQNEVILTKNRFLLLSDVRHHRPDSKLLTNLAVKCNSTGRTQKFYSFEEDSTLSSLARRGSIRSHIPSWWLRGIQIHLHCGCRGSCCWRRLRACER